MLTALSAPHVSLGKQGTGLTPTPIAHIRSQTDGRHGVDDAGTLLASQQFLRVS